MHIEVVPCPVKLPVKFTNTVIIFDDPLTVFDPGVISDINRSALSACFKRNGRELRDIRRICLSHGHVDHIGMAEDLKELSGASIYLHPSDFSKAKSSDSKREHYMACLLSCGLSHNELKHIEMFLNYVAPFYKPVKDPKELPAKLAFDGFDLEVISTPGHTSGSVVFHEPSAGLLISGDTLIKEISPNPVFEFTAEGTRYHSQLAFRQSLIKLSKLFLKRIIPGHGEEIEDFGAVYEKYQTNWMFREKAILEVLQTKTEVSPYEIALALFKEKMEGFNIFLGLSEIIGYLDYFEDKSTIVFTEKNGIIYAQCKN